MGAGEVSTQRVSELCRLVQAPSRLLMVRLRGVPLELSEVSRAKEPEKYGILV